MSEEIFKSILEEAVMREYTDIEDDPDHKFSLKHRLAMKRIFSRYEKNVRKLHANEPNKTSQTAESKPRYRLSRLLFLAMIVILLASFFGGWIAVYVSTNFHGTVYRSYTEFKPKKTMDCPQTIEYKYALVSVPKGFEMIKTDSSPIRVSTQYMNSSTEQTITLRQWVKSGYARNFKTKKHHLENIQVNCNDVLYVDYGDDRHSCTLLVWDNGDYIIEIIADLAKEDAINLSIINKN